MTVISCWAKLNIIYKIMKRLKKPLSTLSRSELKKWMVLLEWFGWCVEWWNLCRLNGVIRFERPFDDRGTESTAFDLNGTFLSRCMCCAAVGQVRQVLHRQMAFKACAKWHHSVETGPISLHLSKPMDPVRCFVVKPAVKHAVNQPIPISMVDFGQVASAFVWWIQYSCYIWNNRVYFVW